MKRLLENKVAVVTGGTRGIGLSIVRKFLEEGASVILCGSREETVTHALQLLGTECPDARVEGIWPDLTDREAMSQALSTIHRKYGRLDILVNNAGISQRTLLEEYTPEEYDRIMDLNVKSVFVCSQAAAGIMKEQGGGVILNTSSVGSFYGQPSGFAYPTSKFSVNGLTKSLARELGRYRIRVNAVACSAPRTAPHVPKIKPGGNGISTPCSRPVYFPARPFA